MQIKKKNRNYFDKGEMTRTRVIMTSNGCNVFLGNRLQPFPASREAGNEVNRCYRYSELKGQLKPNIFFIKTVTKFSKFLFFVSLQERERKWLSANDNQSRFGQHRSFDPRERWRNMVGGKEKCLDNRNGCKVSCIRSKSVVVYLLTYYARHDDDDDCLRRGYTWNWMRF